MGRIVLHYNEGNSLWKAFFLFLKLIYLFFFTYLDLESTGPGPGPEGRRRAEMCRRVFKTLRKMVNIKVFYKKVYNHLNIYTNTQIYIYIFIYTYILYNMAIEKRNYVSNHLIINHIGSRRR